MEQVYQLLLIRFFLQDGGNSWPNLIVGRPEDIANLVKMDFQSLCKANFKPAKGGIEVHTIFFPSLDSVCRFFGRERGCIGLKDGRTAVAGIIP